MKLSLDEVGALVEIRQVSVDLARYYEMSHSLGFVRTVFLVARGGHELLALSPLDTHLDLVSDPLAQQEQHMRPDRLKVRFFFSEDQRHF